jgi:XRE family transcriptional regulator, regulator of sulfur utilization
MKTLPDPDSASTAAIGSSPIGGERVDESRGAMLPERLSETVSKNLGGRIRDLRKERGLTLDALSGRSQVSRAFLSAIERSEKSPTLPIVVRIARGLNVSMSALLGVAPAASGVASNRSADQVAFRDPWSGFERTVLSPRREGGSAEIVKHCIPPGQSSGLLPVYPTVIEKHILVQDGELTALIDGTAYRIARGDTLSFTIRTPYRLCNEGPGPCIYIVVMVDRG